MQNAVTLILKKLRRATRERRVQFTCQAYNRPETADHKFDPCALVHGWGWRYIIGYCDLREAY